MLIAAFFARPMALCAPQCVERSDQIASTEATARSLPTKRACDEDPGRRRPPGGRVAAYRSLGKINIRNDNRTPPSSRRYFLRGAIPLGSWGLLFLLTLPFTRLEYTLEYMTRDQKKIWAKTLLLYKAIPLRTARRTG